MARGIGIIGVGAYLPPEIRKNDWWPQDVVGMWPKKMAAILGRSEADFGFPVTAGVRKAIEGLREHVDDPFFGIKERRVMPEGMTPSQMELLAARDALANARIDPQEIGLLLAHGMVPTFHTYNQAVPLHAELGLSRRCMCTGVDAVCNTFVTQLALATDLLAAGRAKYALLVQSSAVSRIQDNSDWASAFLGDGSTAIVLGPVGEGRGVLSTSHRVDSRNHLGIVTGVANRGWWEEGRNTAMVLDKVGVRRAYFETNDLAVEVLGESLEAAGVKPAEVGFYACHQVAGNMRRQTQELMQMSNARFVDTLSYAGTLSSANLPLQLVAAAREGMLRADEVVAMFSMGAGSTVSSAVLRWGD